MYNLGIRIENFQEGKNYYMLRKLFNVLPTYSLLFGLYPILSLQATNRFEIQGLGIFLIVRPLLLSGLLVFIIYLIFWPIMRSSTAGELSTFLFLFLFFNYGHVENLLSLRKISSNFLLPLWFLLFGSGLILIFGNKEKIPSIKKPFVIATTVLICFPIYEITAYAFASQQTVERLLSNPSQIENLDSDLHFTDSAQPKKIQPSDYTVPFDVYYIILDGYGRSDILADIYQYDNQPFIDQLKERGFFVAENSNANYNQTLLSLPSSLNMEYLQNLGFSNSTFFDLETHLNFLSKSKVFNVFSEEDYFLVSFRSGYRNVDIQNLDYFMQIDGDIGAKFSNFPKVYLFGHEITISNHELLFLQTTILKPFIEGMVKSDIEPPAYQKHRNRILYIFDHLTDFSEADGSYFIYAHILAPHPPYVFNEDGTNRMNFFPFDMRDGSQYLTFSANVNRENYISLYKSQLAYINQLVLETVDVILEKSETPPVIIIQGDHGPGVYLDWESSDNTYLPERFGILNAYYFPDQNYENLYSSISPVNTFRVITGQYLGKEIDYYDDLSFFSIIDKPYGFEDITDQLH